MASSTLSPAASSQLCSSKSGMFCPSQALLVKPTRTQMAKREKGMKLTCQATSIPADRVPDMGKRQLMNLLLLGAISLPTGYMLYPYTYFFVPPG
ncbi:Cytochrome b6-f complex Fe-S subunit [Corchorus olitorius]|uniref:Cytochrome b6-f complex Fe-S subunit n=1 Tax=Corchorus olitorius TaxID=93759 RepID=A0A1R3KP42_9ROSI|nr:Cytochrome b6-f complex Fe-S subunit [Corchorus olitorius]